MTEEHVEPVWIDDQTMLTDDAARQYRAAFAERKTLPLRVNGQTIGTAQLQPDGTVHCTVTSTDTKMQALLQADMDSVSIGPWPGDTEATIIDGEQ